MTSAGGEKGIGGSFCRVGPAQPIDEKVALTKTESRFKSFKPFNR
jgi:hypothetical protein